MFSAEGNVFVRLLLENGVGRDVFVIQGTDYPGQRPTSSSCSSGSALFQTLPGDPGHGVIPFSLMPRATRKTSRECRSGPESVPMHRGRRADRVLTMDLHSPQIQAFSRSRSITFMHAGVWSSIREKEIPAWSFRLPMLGFGKQAYKYCRDDSRAGASRVVFGNQKVRRTHDEHAKCSTSSATSEARTS